MKGVAHFAAGVAAASCFPQAVAAGAQGNPLYFLLGAVFGLLPDTLDFKFVRFFEKHDILVVPDPHNPDPQMVADAVALAVNRAGTAGKPVRIKLGTVRLGADRWQQYSVHFNVAGGTVEAEVGPVVNTGACPVDDPHVAGPNSARRPPSASARLAYPVAIDYEATNIVNIFDGPILQMTPAPGGPVRVEFIPWHRRWSHSLVTALLAGLVAGALVDPLAGAVVFSAMAAHALLDQLGFMGSSLLFPFRRKRSTGLGMTHSDRPLPNLAAVWLSCILVFWNLNRSMAFPAVHANLLQMLIAGALIPLGVFAIADRILAPRGDAVISRPPSQGDIEKET